MPLAGDNMWGRTESVSLVSRLLILQSSKANLAVYQVESYGDHWVEALLRDGEWDV